MYIQTSAPIGAWEVKLEIMTDRPTHRPTDRHTDMRGYREVSLPVRYTLKNTSLIQKNGVIIIFLKSLCPFFFNEQLLEILDDAILCCYFCA